MKKLFSKKHKEEVQHDVHEHNQGHEHHKKNFFKKNLFVIIGLMAIVIIVVLALLLFPHNTNVPSGTDSNTSLSQDKNHTIDLPSNITMTDLQKLAVEMQSQINGDVIEAQLNVLKPYYSELGIDEQAMNLCISDNNFANFNLNFQGAKHLSKIAKDTQLASVVGINGTPGFFINGYMISGVRDYNYMSHVLDASIEDSTKPAIDLSKCEDGVFDNSAGVCVSVESLRSSTPAMVVIYNAEHDFTSAEVDSIINNLKTNSGQYTEFFKVLFDSVQVYKLNYRDVAQLQVLKDMNVTGIPFFYLDGNVEDLNVYKDPSMKALFDKVFEAPVDGRYMLLIPPIQYLNYNVLSDTDDYVIGNKDANVTLYLFTDYDCPYCKQFDEQIQDTILQNYVDTGKVKFVVKDFIVHQQSALFPAIFSRCAQDQGKYLEVHKKLFELKDSIGYTGLVKGIYDSYSDSIDKINKKYQELQSSGATQ